MIVGEINLLKDFNFFYDFSDCLDGDPTAKSTVLKVEDGLLSFELDHLANKQVTSMRLGGML